MNEIALFLPPIGESFLGTMEIYTTKLGEKERTIAIAEKAKIMR